MFLALLFLCCLGYPILTAKKLCDAEKLDPEDPSNYCSFLYIEKRLTIGTSCLVRPERLSPTQTFVGKVEMNCFRENLEGLSSSKLVDALMKKQIPLVVGPGGSFYLTDHHHFALALFEAFLDFKRPMIHKVLYACVQEDLSNLDVPSFWNAMQEQHYVYLKDARGRNITVDMLPTSLKDLSDNPYRTLASWLRLSNGFVKCGSSQAKKAPQCENNKTAPFFLECFWGEVLNARYPLTNYPEFPIIPPPIPDFIWKANFQSQTAGLASVLADAVKYATSPACEDLPGFNESPNVLPPDPVGLTKEGCPENMFD